MRTKLLVCFAVLALLGTAFCAEMTMAEESEATYTIDDALQLLIDLREDSARNILDLSKNWNAAKENLDAQIANLQDSIAKNQEHCDVLDGEVLKTSEDIDDTEKFIQWLIDQIQSKKDNLANLLLRRCEVNKGFINSLKRDKIALSLLEFLKTAIQNKQDFSLAQKKEFNRHLASFLAAYSTNDVSFLVQMKDDLIDSSQYTVDVDFSTQARTDEEIGTGHIDNDKGDLELEDFTGARRKDWAQYKDELIAILNELEAKIQQKMKDAINDEIQASIALADYKNTLLKEIKLFEKQLAKEQQNLADLQVLLIKQQADANKCHADVSSLQNQLDSVELEKKNKQDEYDSKSQSLSEEIDLFTEIINDYSTAIASQDDDFKARQDDYLDNGTFDDGDYDQREVPEIDTLASQENSTF